MKTKFILPAILAFAFLAPPPPRAQQAAQTQPQDPAVLADPHYARAQRANKLFRYQPNRRYGTLDVIANVQDAAFYLGPHFVARTPVSGIKVPEGNYQYRISAARFEDARGNVTVTGSQKSEVNIYLNPAQGRPVVRTWPAGVHVSMGGRGLGVTTKKGLVLDNMQPGKYLLKFEKNGYITQERKLTVVEGKKTGVTAFMQKKYGSVRVVSGLKECYVYVNKIYRGRAPVIVKNLRPGKAVVRVEKNKYAPFVQTVLIRSERTEQIKAVLKKDRSFRNMGPYGKIKGEWGDDDGDGIPDKQDKCPEDPEDVDAYLDQDGCPDPDNDFDGVADIKEPENKYRSMPEDFDGFKDNDGVPDFDNDRDYVPDSADLCPFLAEDMDGFEDLDGCPDTDNDNDKVPDAKDLAPVDPEDIDGFQDQDGAPDLDNDNDGIKDFMDRCPMEAEVFNNFQDDDGCPDVRLPEPRMGMIRGIQYDLKSELTERVMLALDSAYNAMLAYPHIRLEVSVHSDGRGRKRRKLEATEEKAEIIRRYFGYRGQVPADRFEVKAIGGSDPISSNVSEKGREKNTRIEIRRVK
jgi:outer membrane protein OmpA-like peptidoglycan-associated protein